MSIDLALLVPEVLAHAGECQPRECCGLAVVVKGRLRYWPARNIAGSAAEFIITPDDYAAAEDAGEIVGICHSHPYVAPDPSDADRVMVERTGLPWLIVNWPVGHFRVVTPSGYMAPLVGRRFAYGVLDCYQLACDYYASVGIDLPPVERADEFEWWLRGRDLFRDGFAAAGFVRLGDSGSTPLRPHDGLLMQISSPVPNHCAVHVGDNIILQHCIGRLSSRDVYGGYWRKATTDVLRHRSLL